jgi:hypothetical protein
MQTVDPKQLRSLLKSIGIIANDLLEKATDEQLVEVAGEICDIENQIDDINFSLFDK